MLRFVSEVEEGTDIVGMLMIGDPGIRVESAYLDSWLAGLLECVVAVREGADRHEVDLIEEAVPLIAEMADGEVVLRFGAQTTRLGSLVSAVDTITVGVRELLQRVSTQE